MLVMQFSLALVGCPYLPLVRFQLVTQADADAIDLTNRYDWYFMVVQNPDGYLYTWSDASTCITSVIAVSCKSQLIYIYMSCL